MVTFKFNNFLDVEVLGFQTKDDFINMLNNVNWSEGGHTHNWKNHIPKTIIKSWNSLHIKAKIIAYIMAEEQADKEEYL